MTPPGEDPWLDLKIDELNEERIKAKEEARMRDQPTEGTKREQDREFEKATSVDALCSECGQRRDMHAIVQGVRLDVENPVVLICPRSTFTPYR